MHAKIEVANKRIGNDLGIFSNLNIKKKVPNKSNVEITTLLIIEMISWSEAYLQIPWYKRMYFNRNILDKEKSIMNGHKPLERINALAKSSRIQRAIKKERPKIIKSWSIVNKILKFTVSP